MDAFTMEIAGAAIRVQPLFESTQVYCREYLTDKVPEVFVEVIQEDLTLQQQLLDQEAAEEGLKRRVFKDPFLERMTIQRKVADALLTRGVLMLHGSTVAVDGAGYLFTAPCGTGKSTHTRLWRELFGPRAVMVNDDKPFLWITETGVLAYGSPWSGKHGLASNIRVPLKGICLLQRGKENQIRSIGAGAALPVLGHQAHRPEDGALAETAMALVERIAETVPLWELQCNMDLEAARVSYGAMAAAL